MFSSLFSSAGKTVKLEGKAKLAANRFDSDEVSLLHKTWQELADRSNGKGIDKDTFLQYFPLNGLLGERLFAEFDTKGGGFVGFDEFIIGLAIVCRGTSDEKIHFIFNMYDVSHDNSVSRQELTTLLNQIPKDQLKHVQRDRSTTRDTRARSQSGQNSGEDSGGESSVYDENFEEIDNYTNEDVVARAFEECDLTHEGRLTFPAFKMWLTRNPEVLEFIESILPYNGLRDFSGPQGSHRDRAPSKQDSLPHLKRISSKASMMSGMFGSKTTLSEFAGDIFNHSTRKLERQHSGSNAPDRMRSNTSFSALSSSRHGERSMSDALGSSRHGVLSPPSYPESTSSSHASTPVGQGGGSGFPPVPPSLRRTGSFTNSENEHMDNEEMVRSYIHQAWEMTGNESLKKQLRDILESLGEEPTQITATKYDSMEVYKTVVALEDYLWKKGKAFHMWSRRYYLVSGNCMYYYSNKDDVRPKGVIFLTGSIVESLKDESSALKGYFGFELLHQDLCTGEHHRHDKRVLYCRSEQLRDKWVTALQHAAHVVPIEDDYVIGKELGRGRFSVVCECVNKATGEHAAVKIIDKSTIEPEEKGLLRTEIAVLKLVNHPNIIRMEGLYETKKHLYIVMEMLKGGELFERIVGRPRFSELEAAKLLRPLLESVAYLHDLGIVHRDLKPENILCGEELEDLKIADFGLSKMVLPKEKMDAACGTLSYVAPEVLTMQGYGKEADLWSVGVIMFLLLCGKLPFDGDDHNEIIRSTIQAELKVNSSVWGKLSDESKSLMMALLNKNPKERISARDSLVHPFILQNAPHHRRMTSNDKQLLAAAAEAAVSAPVSSSSSITPAPARPRSPRAEDSLAAESAASSSTPSSSSPPTTTTMTPRKEGSTGGIAPSGYGQGMSGTATTVSTYHNLPEPHGSPSPSQSPTNSSMGGSSHGVPGDATTSKKSYGMGGLPNSSSSSAKSGNINMPAMTRGVSMDSQVSDMSDIQHHHTSSQSATSSSQQHR